MSVAQMVTPWKHLYNGMCEGKECKFIQNIWWKVWRASINMNWKQSFVHNSNVIKTLFCRILNNKQIIFHLYSILNKEKEKLKLNIFTSRSYKNFSVKHLNRFKLHRQIDQILLQLISYCICLKSFQNRNIQHLFAWITHFQDYFTLKRSSFRNTLK